VTGGSFLLSELGKMEPLKRYRAARTMPRPSTTTSEDGEAISFEGCRLLVECKKPGVTSNNCQYDIVNFHLKKVKRKEKKIQGSKRPSKDLHMNKVPE
jgi:hypothetical protein